MNTMTTIKPKRRKKLTSLLALALDGLRLTGVVLRRNNDGLQQQQTLAVTLTLDPLTAAPELVGREIRNHLDAAGVREKNCVVGVPLKWVLTAQTELPKLDETDAANLLQMEMERGFPCDVATLRLAQSTCELADGKQLVTMAGIPNSQLAILEQVLAAAKLRPVSFALGLQALRLQALQPPGGEKSDGVLALFVGESLVSLQITSRGGVASLRGLEGAIEAQSGRPVLNPGLVSREVRITLGQLPAEVRGSVKRIRVFGPRELAQQLADEMELKFEPLGMKVELVAAYAAGEFGLELPAGVAQSAAFSLGARALAEQYPVFEFLPPKPTVLQQLSAKYASGRLQTVSLAAAAVVLLFGGLFGWQEFQLVRLHSQWNAMRAKVNDLDALSKLTQKYSPWFDPTYQDLSILRVLSITFPETGLLTAKTINVRDGNIVSCNGTAENTQAVLDTQDRLRQTDGVFDLNVKEIRGKTPEQFTIDFRWGNKIKGGNEN
jgi:hypothetical protein